MRGAQFSPWSTWNSPFTIHARFPPPPASHVPPAAHLAAAAYRFGGFFSETDLGTGPVRASQVFGPDTHNWIGLFTIAAISGSA